MADSRHSVRNHPSFLLDGETELRVHTAFIVRPFGLKDGFDFDSVERDLIRPALERLRERHHVQVVGGTTGEIVKQGNIRPDMFRLLGDGRGQH